MAPSAKFVSVNLNKSYGQSSSSSSASSSVFTRSRSYGSSSSSISHGGMVSLSRPSTRISSSSSSSVPSPLPRMPSSSSSSSSLSSSSSVKLSVPRPVNLPSLRREHAGNDPTVSLIAGSAGSSHGWIRQTTEENQQDLLNRPRIEAFKNTDSVKGNSLPSSFPSLSSTSSSSSVQGKNGGQDAVVSAYTPPGSRPSPHTHSIASSSSSSSSVSLVSHIAIEKAVVFRGEDFPSLQASVPSPGVPLQYRQQQRDAQPKQQDKPFLMQSEPKKTHHNQEESQVIESVSTGSESTGIRTESRLDSHGQEIFQKNADDGGRAGEEGRSSRGPSPLIRLSHISNWADDERETLSSFQPQERSQLGHGETYSTLDNWASDHGDTKRPTSRNGYSGRNDADMSTFIPKNGYNKDGSQFANNGSKFERDYRGGDFDRLDVTAGGRNDYLKRGWSFSSVELTGTRDTKVYSRVANIPRNDGFGSEFSSRDTRQGQEYRSSKNVYGKLGGSGVHGLQGERNGRGSSFLYDPSDVPMPRKSNPRLGQMGSDYNPRERRSSAFREQIRNEDPFLGDIMDTRAGSFMGSVGLDVKVSRMKKEPLKDENVRDLARESFEAELERVQKMLELESQRAAEEQERAIELARKEQEERERIAREEEEMRQKLEEEAREAALRAEREAEEAARRVEELRRIREEEKRMAALEEERRKEAARKKLLEIEERMARRQEQSMQKQGIGSGEEVGPQRNNDLVEKESQGKFMHGSSKDDQGEQSSNLPSILKSPFGPSNGKEGLGLSTQRSRYSQEWKRESFDSGQEAHSTHQGSTRSAHARGDFNHADYDEQRSFRRSPAMNGDTHDRAPSNNPRDKDVGNWWIRDDPSRLEPPVESYGTEYPPFGRLRQSLPKQPRVLPPPPGPIMAWKQHFQSDHNESKSESSVIGINSSMPEHISRKDSSAEIAIEAVVSHKMNKEEDVVDMAVAKQFENVPSEEVVLSDAVSQFSDDTLEDERDSTGQMYQDQDSHSDMVSETYSEDVDEISDLTDAQTSSEEVEASTELQTPKEEEPRENNAKKIGEARNEIEVKVEDGKTINQSDKLLVNGEDISIGEDGGKLHLVMEDEVHRSGANNGYKGEEETRIAEEKLVSFVPVDTQTGPKALATQKAVQDQVMHHYSHHIPFLSMSTMDASQIAHHSEGLGSRQSLVQQFQQPFSFMAVPLPQPSNLNNVPANQSIPSSTQGLQNQQDLPFLQLGLLSGVPLMPNAIQIGSIQMPLHIHPHIPQYAQLHSQQQPIFQFGQIGHTGPISHTSTILQPGLQIHTTVGQSMLPQHHQLQSECVHVKETVNVASNSEQLMKVDVDAVEQVQSIENMPTSQSDEHVEGNQVALSTVPQDCVKDSSVGERAAANLAKPHWARNRASNVDAVGGKPGGYIRKDLNTVSGRQSRGRRRHDASSYQGILGRGRGRFRSGQNNRSQGSHVAESWPERGPKRGSQGRIYHKSARRLEYKVRTPMPPIDGEPATAEITEGLAMDFLSKDGHGEVAKGAIVNKDSGTHPKGGDSDMNKMNAYSGGQPKHASVKAPTQNNQVSNKGLHKRYEVDSPEDAPLRNGVVFVFEQPGIETQNDKDDFIEVRSKRQLLREQREQREKDNKAKSMDSGVSKTQRSTMKAGVVNSNKSNTSNTKKSFGQGNEMQSIENRPMASQRRTGTGTTVSQTSAITTASHAISSTRGTKIKSKPSDSLKKSTSTLPKPAGQASSSSNVASNEAAGSGGYQLESRGNEPSISTAWGGQRSNQEVVSFTQIQLEEAMKPFRLEGHFPDQSHIPERAPVLLDTGIPHIAVSGSEKSTIPINVPGSISSLLAGEKIQFGAVTSSPPIPSSSPLSPLSNAQMMELRSEASRVSHFLESDGETVFTAKEKHGGVHDSFQVKVIDLEAEAEAAASAVAVAAISNEDVIQSHSVLGSGGINGDDTHSIPTTSGLRPVVVQAMNNGSNENPISVSLPADLLVEMPPPLYQPSPVSLPASSGVMLQSLPGGLPPYPCLEMGPMLGGPIFTYGPREDASFASMDTGLAGWQQRHLGTPDSFYGTSSFMNPAGLSGIQGHPHMVVYANPFTPVGQFGQLGVGFMGATYHPSKQPDWTHIPMPSSSSGALGLNDGEINAGMMVSRHTNGVSNPNAPQQLSVPGPSVMPLSTPSVFEAGLSAPFQSHWSKAPAPPVSSMAISGSAQTGSVVGSTLDLTQPHLSRVVQNQMGHIAHLMDVSSGFNELPVLKPVARSSFSSSDATPQFPDELGLGETPATTPSGNSLLLNDLGVDGSISVESSAGKLGRQNRRAPRPPHGGKGGLNVTSEHEQIEFQKHHSKNNSIRMGPPSAGRASPPIPFPDTRVRVSQQNTATTDSVRTEWLGGNQRRGTSGRFVSDRVSSGQSSKVKQIYVPKSTTSASTKLGAIADSAYRL